MMAFDAASSFSIIKAPLTEIFLGPAGESTKGSVFIPSKPLSL